MRELEEYYRPASPQEAVDIKLRLGARAMYLGGGTDILVHRHRRVEALIDTRHMGLGFAEQREDGYAIGGAALLRDAEVALGEVAGGMLRVAIQETAPWLIRNQATLVGNLVNASPAADSVPALIAADAQLVLLGPGEEVVSAESVLVGPHRTSLGDRLVREIRIPRWAAERRGWFMKLSRSHSDIAQVNAAVSALVDGGTLRDVRIVLGAVGPTAMRIERAEQAAEGRELSDDLLERVSEIVQEDVRPISDWRASETYRRRMSGVLVRRGLKALVNDEGPGGHT